MFFRPAATLSLSLALSLILSPAAQADSFLTSPNLSAGADFALPSSSSQVIGCEAMLCAMQWREDEDEAARTPLGGLDAPSDVKALFDWLRKAPAGLSPERRFLALYKAARNLSSGADGRMLVVLLRGARDEVAARGDSGLLAVAELGLYLVTEYVRSAFSESDPLVRVTCSEARAATHYAAATRAAERCGRRDRILGERLRYALRSARQYATYYPQSHAALQTSLDKEQQRWLETQPEDGGD